ncbi:hypothetical protein FKM82_001666 [Ascaphus truei]
MLSLLIALASDFRLVPRVGWRLKKKKLVASSTVARHFCSALLRYTDYWQRNGPHCTHLLLNSINSHGWGKKTRTRMGQKHFSSFHNLLFKRSVQITLFVFDFFFSRLVANLCKNTCRMRK